MLVAAQDLSVVGGHMNVAYRIPAPPSTPKPSSSWIGPVAPVDPSVTRPMTEGLAVPTLVSDPSGMAPFDVEPIGFHEALRRAAAGSPELVAA